MNEYSTNLERIKSMHQVFISHSSQDANVADEICVALENEDIHCWIAPRDISPGATWGGAIVDAIEHSKVLLLILSTHSNLSQQVLREVERAVSKGVVILPIKISDVELSKTLEYFLSTAHWLNAHDLPPSYLATIVDSVKNILDPSQQVQVNLQQNAPAQNSKGGGKSVVRTWAVALSALMVLFVGTALWRVTANDPTLSEIEQSNIADEAVNTGASEKSNLLHLGLPVLAVEHFRTDETGVPIRYGTIGSETTETIRFNDLVRLSVSSVHPRHMTVLALNPNGTVQLCWPEDPHTEANKTKHFSFPSEPDLYFALTDGRGQQAFVLITSKEPIIGTDTTMKKLEREGWSHNDTGGFWQFNKEGASQLFMARINRGTVKRFSATQFVKACEFLQSRLSNAEILGIAFPVE